LVRLLLDIIPRLKDVVILCFFLTLAFALLGLQLWQGVLRATCYDEAGAVFDAKYTCSMPGYGTSCAPALAPL
jgi:Ion transport protein